jgi:hypothetical protein
MQSVHIGMDAWIIQDGNYGDFEAGGHHRFALEFHPHDLAPVDSTSEGPRHFLHHQVGALHEVRGTIVRATQSNWVIDFGVPAFQDFSPPTWAKVGGQVQGVAYIGIDPFFYSERLKNEAGMPDLFRNWLIRRIWLETTPWVESPTLISRAEVPPTFAEVSKTDAWHDDQERAHYVLECEPRGAG